MSNFFEQCKTCRHTVSWAYVVRDLTFFTSGMVWRCRRYDTRRLRSVLTLYVTREQKSKFMIAEKVKCCCCRCSFWFLVCPVELSSVDCIIL